MHIREIERQLWALSAKANELATALKKARQVEVWLKPGERIQNHSGRAFLVHRGAIGGMSGHLVADNYEDVVICEDCGGGVTSKIPVGKLFDLFPRNEFNKVA